MPKHRNIPQAIKDNVLHYINQVYDEAYELGYQHGKRQGESDIEKTQRMIENAVQSLQELTVKQTNKPDDLPCDTCEYLQINDDALPCRECMYMRVSKCKGEQNNEKRRSNKDFVAI